MGDLNCNMLVHTNPTKQLLLLTEENNLTQLITEPTRITQHSQSLIDVLFVSNPDHFSSAGIFPLTGSDHLAIYGESTEKFIAPCKVS